MPQIRLSSIQPGPPIPVELPTGDRLLLPRIQYRCWVKLPGFLMPRDAIIDTDSPWTWMPESLWSQFQVGVDFEWLPFPAGYQAPSGQSAGWTFRFRIAQMLKPIIIQDYSSEVERHNALMQFAEGNPPRSSKRLPYLVVGLWGGMLEGTKLINSPNLQNGSLDALLEF